MSSICTCHPPSVHHVTSHPSLNTRRRASRQSCCVAAFHRPSHTAAPAGTPSLTSRHARSSTRSMPRPTTLHRFSPCHFRCRPLLPQHPQFAGHLYDSVPRRRDPLLEIEPRFLLRGSGASDGPIPMGAGTLHAITPRSASHSDAPPAACARERHLPGTRALWPVAHGGHSPRRLRALFLARSLAHVQASL